MKTETSGPLKILFSTGNWESCGCKIGAIFTIYCYNVTMSAETGTASQRLVENKVDVGDLIPINGLFCSITSLYTEYPDCVGCSGKSVMCCIETDFLACKLPKEGMDPRILCTCQKGTTLCVNPTTCLKGQQQSFCFDTRCALPLDDDVPCLLTILPCCIVASFGECNIACFSKIKDLKNYPGNQQQDGAQA